MTRNRAYLLIVLIALVGGVYLRFHDLRAVPAWYPDEGSNIVISADLARGELAYMAIGESSFINGHPHLYYLLLAGLFRAFGVDILWARILSASLGSLSLLLLFPIFKAISGKNIAVVSTVLYAFYPGAVSYSRLAFTYNLLTPIYLIVLYAIHQYLRRREVKWLMLAAICGGMAPAVELAGAALPIFVVLVLVIKHPRHVLVALPVMVLPTLAWGLWMWAWAGEAFLFDLAFTLSRTGASVPLQIAQAVLNYYSGLMWDVWFALGSFGLFLLPNRRSRGLVTGFYCCTVLFMSRTVGLGGLAYYFAIPLHPLISVGIASLLAEGLPAVLRQFETDLHSWLSIRLPNRRWRSRLVVVLNSGLIFVFLLSPFLTSLYEATSFESIQTIRLGQVGIFADPETASQATFYVNLRTSEDDVVLTSPTIAWLIEANAAGFQMAVLATGQDSYHMPGNIPASRFRFDPSLANASYVILDPLWRGWASGKMDAVAAMVETIENEWTMDRQFGEFEVYSNPLTEEE
jgi:4-amino-4-deoxy-L-arabinose transferase-like glycosyltransferase